MCDKFQEIKKQLLTQVESQMAHLECVDTKEMGEVIDMIKDLEEAIYYCTITEAMNEFLKPHIIILKNINLLIKKESINL